MRAAVRPTRLTRPALWLMLMTPVIAGVLVLLSTVQGGLSGQAGSVLGLGCILAVWVLWRGYPGKYPTLCLCLLVWLVVLAFAAGLIGGLVGAVLVCAGAFGLGVLAFHAALPWPAARAARLQARGRGTVEWEWVYVPRGFARAHPLYRFGIGIWLVAGMILGSFALHLVAGPVPGFLVTYGVLVVLTLLFMVAKGAVAYPLVYLSLLPGLPFTLPAIVYWADGVRPNLIYRHRFERLCREETGDV